MYLRQVLIKEYGQSRLRELDEHKKRRLCERLAKELSAPKTERTASTVGKMVLSTGLLHGIGIAASSSGPKDQSTERTVVKSADLPNGNPKAVVTSQGSGGDLWTNLLKMTMKKTDGCGSENKATPGTDTPSSGVPSSQERKLFPTLRRKCKQPETGNQNDTKSSSFPSHLSPKRQRSVESNRDDVSDVTATRRLAGILTKKRGAQPRPGKLWSLGSTIGKSPATSVSRSINPKSTDANPSADHRSVSPSPVDGHVTDRTRDEQTESVPTLRLIAPVPSSDGTQSSVQSSNRENISPNKSSEEDEDSRTVQGSSSAAGTAFRLSEPPSTVKFGTSPVRATKPLTTTADVNSKLSCPDFQTVCSELSDMIRNFVHGELVSSPNFSIQKNNNNNWSTRA